MILPVTLFPDIRFNLLPSKPIPTRLLFKALLLIIFELLTFHKAIPVTFAFLTEQLLIMKYTLEFCILIQKSKLLSTSIVMFSIM